MYFSYVYIYYYFEIFNCYNCCFYFLGQQLKYCPAPDIERIGACGSDGQRDCFVKVVGSNPASRMPRKIRCVDIGENKSKCTGEIVC